MSLTKLIKAPIKLFRKDVITFLIIRRHDLGNLEDKLRYLAVKANSSLTVLRQKVWHLLDLPDYCEEIITLKCDDKEIPLTALRKGNNPHHPFILEVWSPETRLQSSPRINMLTLGFGEKYVEHAERIPESQNLNNSNENANPTISNETIELKGFKYRENNCAMKPCCEFKKSDLSCRISSTSFFKMNSRKNLDSFTNILLKIQSDLCTLSNKLSNLENRIPL